MSHAFSHLPAPSPSPTPHTDSDTHINNVNIYTFTHIREHTNSYIYVKHFCAFMNICSYARAHTHLSTHPHTQEGEVVIGEENLAVIFFIFILLM